MELIVNPITGKLIPSTAPTKVPAYIVVKRLSDLPAPVLGFITLVNNTTYVFSGIIDIGAFIINASLSNTLMGFDKSDDGIIGTSTLINVSNHTLSVVNLRLISSTTALSATLNASSSLQIRECIITQATPIIVLGNAAIVAINANIFTGAGIESEANITKLAVADNFFQDGTKTAIKLTLGTYSIIKLISNDITTTSAIGIDIDLSISISATGGGTIIGNSFAGGGIAISGVTADTNAWLLSTNNAAGNVDTVLGISPNITNVLRDDFIVGSSASGDIGGLGWKVTSGVTAQTNSIPGRPGMVQRTTVATINTVASMYIGQNSSSAAFTAQDFHSCIWIARIISPPSSCGYLIGVTSDANNVTIPPSGIFFRLSATNWQAVCRNANVETSVTLSTAVINVWYKFAIFKTSSAVKFYIDNVLVATINSNIPSASTGLQYAVAISPLDASTKATQIDYFSGTLITNTR